jgi:hypothetical protein
MPYYKKISELDAGAAATGWRESSKAVGSVDLYGDSSGTFAWIIEGRWRA